MANYLLSGGNEENRSGLGKGTMKKNFKDLNNHIKHALHPPPPPSLDLSKVSDMSKALVDQINDTMTNPHKTQHKQIVTAGGDRPIHDVKRPHTAAHFRPVTYNEIYENIYIRPDGTQRDLSEHVYDRWMVHPMDLPAMLWQSLKDLVNWVLWNIQDFRNLLAAWDGSISGLLYNYQLLWRGAVLAMITMGVVEIVPIMNALANWLRLAWEVLGSTFGLMGDALREVEILLTRIWNDISSLW